MKWSIEQEKIFKWFAAGQGSLVVEAFAGTGKTTTIKQAFSHVPGQPKMLYAVFNKKNQLEAQAKITDQRVQIKTLHGLGYAFVRRAWGSVRPDDAVEDDRIAKVAPNAPGEVLNAIKKSVAFAKNTRINPTPQDIMEIIDRFDLNDFMNPESVNEWSLVRVVDCAMKVLAISKERDPEGRISFNDMVWLPVACNMVRPWFDLVVIDEAQDMNEPQLAMARLACKRTGRICVVGDSRQAIYGFRGARHRAMDYMRGILHAETLGLTTTYRCPKLVVQIANEFVPAYRAADSAPDGIVESMSQDKMLDTLKPGDSVLSRKNAPLMPLCLSLLRKGVRARIEGRDIGKQLAALAKSLRASSVPDFISRLDKWAKRKKTRAMRNQKTAEEKCEQIDDQVSTLLAVSEDAKSIEDIYGRLTELFQDNGDGKSSVILSTVHKAKGLEWPKVFLIEETFSRRHQSEDEGNIYYVAVTRAMQHLVNVGIGAANKN